MRSLEPNRRTRHIRGPLGALIHQMLLLGWGPGAPDIWHGPDFTWKFDANQLHSLDQARGLLDDYTSSLQALQWKAASAHFCGAGREGGVDNQSLRFLLTQLQDVPHGRQLAELLLCVAAGGAWLETRKCDA
eukprot:3383699-Pyramimonas_sp.AAC.1